MNNFVTRTGVVLAALLLLNILSAFVFFRLDLTAEKRYTLSGATHKLLTTLDDDVHVTVYLTGDLPPGFKRLENAVRETLDEFRAIVGNKITYRFVDIDAQSSPKEKAKLIETLAQKGIFPSNVVDTEGGKRTEKIVVPGAMVSYKGKESPVLLLKGNKAATSEEQLNQSYEGVEYQVAAAIRKLTQPVGNRPRVGLVFGHTNVPPSRFADVLASIQENYDLFFVDIAKPEPISGVDALLVAKPDKPFSEAEIFRLDQFVVNGGRALFFVDGVRVDSVAQEGSFAQPLNVGLDDLFFRWGVRINRNVLKDLLCNVIMLNVGNLGDKPNIQPVPWRFYPVINSFGKSAITKNLDAVWLRFASTLDTVAAPGVGGQPILKTPLLLTSPYTKLLTAPAVIAYNEARQQPDPKTYNSGVRLVGCLLEGRFRSLFANRILPSDPRSAGFRADGVASRVLVCADGDLLINDVNYKTQTPYPLGYDRYTRQTFANKDFALNALDYLIDPDGLITARARQITLRPLDKIRLETERSTWQLLNLLGPLALVGIVGIVWQAVRRRRFGA
jgi:ABC-2 type transport system permease protein